MIQLVEEVRVCFYTEHKFVREDEESERNFGWLKDFITLMMTYKKGKILREELTKVS